MISLGYVPINQWIKQNQINWTGKELLFVLFGGWLVYDFISKRY